MMEQRGKNIRSQITNSMLKNVQKQSIGHAGHAFLNHVAFLLSIEHGYPEYQPLLDQGRLVLPGHPDSQMTLARAKGNSSESCLESSHSAQMDETRF